MTSSDVESAGSGSSPKETVDGKSLETAIPAASGFMASGMSVTFKDLTYSVVNSANKKERLNLLEGVSGYLRAGELVALMGPSGSGKTTLLDVLAGRKTVGKLQGELKFAGEKPTQQFLRRFTGYVEQQDTLLPILSVEEMLMYTAEMQRPRSESLERKRAVVEEIIDVLALNTCRTVKIGSQMAKGISGGQAKRVNIGISMVANPSVLFLDEPSSGLDSYTSNEVMATVQRLARHGITVCATIHSPTPYCFGLFDRLMLLLRGRVVYFGRNGSSAIDYFENRCPHLPNLLENQNPAEFIVDLTTQADRRGKAGDFADGYQKSDLKMHADNEIEAQLKLSSTLDDATRKALTVKRATTTPAWWALWVMFRYRTTKNYKDINFLGPRIFDKLLFAFVIFSLYWKVGSNLQADNVVNVAGILFMVVTLPAYAAVAYVPSIVLERPLFTRERNDGFYLTGTYLVFKLIEEIVIAVAVSLIFANLVFWLVQLQGSFLLFWLIYFVTLSIGITLGYTIAAISPNLDVANGALPAYTTVLLFFAGFLLREDQIPGYWIWMHWIDYLTFGWGALMSNQFAGDRDVPYVGGYTILGYFSLGGVSGWAWLGIEFGFFIFFIFSAYLALRFVNHVKR